MNILDRYHEALNNIPSPGAGCHASLLSVANYGSKAGIQPQKIHEDIRSHIPPGVRRVPDREILAAVSKALSDNNGKVFTSRPKPVPIVNNGKITLQQLINQGKISDDADLWESSPVRLLDDLQEDPIFLLENLYEPEELVWIGDRHQAGVIGDTIRTIGEWIAHFRNGAATAPHIIINPLTGTPVLKKAGGGQTLRGDGNVASYRYCLIEFDNLTREEQIRFWSAVKLPIVSLIDSGGKSIHAWLDVQKLAAVTTSEAWQSEIKYRLYDRILTPMGVDAACCNAARLSRLPGHYRAEKETYQRLLWLSPEGRPIR